MPRSKATARPTKRAAAKPKPAKPTTTKLAAAFKRDFGYLADTAGFEPILEAIAADVTAITTKGTNTIVTFGGNERLIAYPPKPNKRDTRWPASFRRLLSHHARVEAEASRLYLMADGTWDPGAIDDFSWSELISAENVLCPLTDYSDWWLYHPTQKNPQGEPTLHFFSHAGDVAERGEAINAGALFLKRLADVLDLGVDMRVTTSNVPTASARDWAHHLIWALAGDERLYHYSDDPPSAVAALPLERATEISVRDISALRQLPLARLSALERLDVSGDSTKLVDLAGIEALASLRHLDVEGQEVADLRPLARLPALESLQLGRNRVKDLTPLAKCRALETIRLRNNKVTDLAPLAALPKLETLDLADNPIKTIAPLYGITTLRELTVPPRANHAELVQLKTARTKLKLRR